MKKIIIILIILALIGTGGYYYYNNIYLPSLKPTIETEKSKVSINKYYIYGTHLNIEGNIKKINAKFKDVDLILWNIKDGKTKKYEINYSKNVNAVDFNISDEINNGIYLDSIAKGNYQLYLRFTYEDKTEKSYKYYPLDNKTDYEKTTYYTTSKINNKITIAKDDTTMTIKVKENEEEVYDIVIDPARGGVDTGAVGNGYKESDITMQMANKLKTKLEEQGLKVKLTRTEDSLASDEYFDEYNDGGRAVIAREVNAKYLFTLQATSSSKSTTSGFSIYTAVGINYDFAAKLVENIIAKTNLKTSALTSNRIDYGIYSHNFTESEIKENMDYYDSKGYKRYNVKTNSNYLYMIRESGGIITGAYVDDSNPEKIGTNPYYNSNVGTEAYIITLGYLTNKDDITAITTNQDSYIEAISTTIIEELKY